MGSEKEGSVEIGMKSSSSPSTKALWMTSTNDLSTVAQLAVRYYRISLQAILKELTT